MTPAEAMTWDEWNATVWHVLCVRRWAIKDEIADETADPSPHDYRNDIYDLEDAIDARDLDAFARAEVRIAQQLHLGVADWKARIREREVRITRAWEWTRV